MLTGKYDLHYIIFKLPYPVAREREYKMGVLGETASFMALLWCPHPLAFYARLGKSKDYNFTINSIELGEISDGRN